MKGPDKLLLIVIFGLLNLGAAFVISRFFEVSWAVIAVCMVIVHLVNAIFDEEIILVNYVKKMSFFADYLR